jgi:uncharacterized membrane protein YeaQ/YmgE (transglycosylase-associated protein family)
MIGIGFSVFATLVVLGFITSFALHVLLRYRVLAGFDGFVFTLIAGWFGGWLGSAVFGHWGMHMGNFYIVPAVLGTFSVPFLATAAFRALRMPAQLGRTDSPISQPVTTQQIEMRKVS